MPWNDQQPRATDVIANIRPYGKHTTGWFEIDKLDDGQYRVTYGTLLDSEEVMRGHELEPLLRGVYAAVIAEDVAGMRRALAPYRAKYPPPSARPAVCYRMATDMENELARQQLRDGIAAAQAVFQRRAET